MSSLPPARLDSLTSLRWVAASLVFLSHVQELVVPQGTWLERVARQGSSGVSFFFVLSGFVLVWSMRMGTSTTDFYRRRFARIYPAYVVVAIISVPVIAALGEIHEPLHLAEAAFPLALLQAWIPHYRITYGGNGVSWSLSCEAFFYALFPFIVGRLAASRRTTQYVLILVTLIAPLLLAIALHPSSDQSARYLVLYTNPLARLPEFVLGMLLALLVRSGWKLQVGVAPVALLAAGAYLAAGWAPLHLRAIPITLLPFSLLILVAAQQDLEGRTPRLLRSATMIKLGQWSFAFYLVHQMVLRVIAELGPFSDAEPAFVGVGTYLVSTGLAAVVFTFIEQPLERRLRGVPSSP